MNPIIEIALAASLLIMSGALLLAVRTSRRAVKWNEQRTAEAVDRVVDGMFARLADEDEEERPQ